MATHRQNTGTAIDTWLVRANRLELRTFLAHIHIEVVGRDRDDSVRHWLTRIILQRHRERVVAELRWNDVESDGVSTRLLRLQEWAAWRGSRSSSGRGRRQCRGERAQQRRTEQHRRAQHRLAPQPVLQLHHQLAYDPLTTLAAVPIP